MDRRCIKRFEIHEVLVTKENADKTAFRKKRRLTALGFIEFVCGGVLARGDGVQMGNDMVGQIVGFEDRHLPDYVGIVVRVSNDVSKLKKRLDLGRSIIFTQN